MAFRARGEKNYGAKVKMDIPTARRAKPGLRALAEVEDFRSHDLRPEYGSATRTCT